MHYFPPHLSYVPTLPENTLTTDKLCCLLLTMCMALKRLSFDVSRILLSIKRSLILISKKILQTAF